jgi:hypothetical protein
MLELEHHNLKLTNQSNKYCAKSSFVTSHNVCTICTESKIMSCYLCYLLTISATFLPPVDKKGRRTIPPLYLLLEITRSNTLPTFTIKPGNPKVALNPSQILPCVKCIIKTRVHSRESSDCH